MIRAKKVTPGEVITAALVAAGLRVPSDLMRYFNAVALGEVTFLGFLALFNLCLAVALRGYRVHAHGGVLAQGSVPPSDVDGDDETGKAPRPMSVVSAAVAVAPAVAAVPAAVGVTSPVDPIAVNAPVTAVPLATNHTGMVQGKGGCGGWPAPTVPCVALSGAFPPFFPQGGSSVHK